LSRSAVAQPVASHATTVKDVTDDYPGTWMVLIALAAITGIWIALFIVRVHAHQANVDDFLYAQASRHIFQSNPVNAVLSSGQASSLVPLLAVPGVAIGGLYGAMSVELPILLLLCLGTFVLARTWLPTPASVLVTLVVGLNAAVLAYAVMLNFALASTASLVWCFAAYLRSERMHRSGWSAALGASFAALVLSRSMAPVYALPLVVVVGADALWGSRKAGARVGRPALLALGLVVVIAGPWWVRSGPQAVHYLLNAGYQPSSGFTSRGVSLSPQAVVSRSNYELKSLGWIQSIMLGAALAVSLAAWFRSRSDKFPRLWMLWAWSVLTLLVLSSSHNLGSAFGLPIIVTLIVACGVVLGKSIRRYRSLVAVAVVAGVALSSTGEFSASTNLWWPGPPYRAEVLSAGGTPRTNVDMLAANVADEIGRGRTVLDAENAVLNINGIRWYRPRNHPIMPSGPNPTSSAIQSLQNARSLITGSTEYSFEGQRVNEVAVESAAVRRGFHPAKIWAISPTNNVVLWNRGPETSAAAHTAPVVRIVKPADGSEVAGPTFLLAQAHDLFGVSSVTFKVSGGPGTYKAMLPAKQTPFGWLGGWNPSQASPGLYTLTCVASNLLGATARSSPISIRLVPRG
jgi:Bacterial Ig domain